jgi:hypothetical protein
MGLSDRKTVEHKPRRFVCTGEGFLLCARPYIGEPDLVRIPEDRPRRISDEVGRTGDHIFMMLVGQKIDAETLRQRVIKYQDEFKIIGAYYKGHFDLALQRAIDEGRVFKDGDLYHLADKYNPKK